MARWRGRGPLVLWGHNYQRQKFWAEPAAAETQARGEETLPMQIVGSLSSEPDFR